jgi:hypothetical protein
MFSLTLLDHLRLTFSQISQRHKAHAAIAKSKGRWNRLLRGSEALLMLGVSMTTMAAAFGESRIFIIVAAALAGIALLVLVVHLTFDFDTLAHQNAASSAHLWRIRERYRSLLTDLHEGVVDVAEARVRRDRLIEELGGIFETAEITPADDEPLPEADVTVPAHASSVPN